LLAASKVDESRGAAEYRLPSCGSKKEEAAYNYAIGYLNLHKIYATKPCIFA